MSKISISIPCYNEAKRLPLKLKPYIEYLEKNFPDYEIIFVDDGSTDNTLEILNHLAAGNKKIKVIRLLKNRGRGFGMKTGVLAAEGKYILETDADLPVSPDHIAIFMNFLEKNPDYDIVIGSREHRESKFPLSQPPLRVFAGKAFHILFKIFFGSQFKDVMCGFKMFRRETAKNIFRYVFDERFLAAGEIIYVANRLGCRIKEMPIVWTDDRRSKVKVLRDTLCTLRGMLEIKIRNRKGMYPKKIMSFQKAKKEIMRLYGGWGWPAIFTYIRLFITAPFKKLEPYIPKEGLIIDLGCGYGIFANLLGLLSEKRKIIGIDLDEYKMRFADKGIKNVEFKLADITKISLPPTDCILLIHVLHHLNFYEEQKELIRACVDKLGGGGKLIIAEIDRKPWWKFILTQIADRLLYHFQKPLYCFPSEMLSLLREFPLDIKIESTHQGTPFSHISYICTKT